MKTISIKITDDLDARLLSAARERRISRSKLIRDILARSLHAKPDSEALSAHDELRTSLGIVRSGVSDLATRPDHLEGFGK